MHLWLSFILCISVFSALSLVDFLAHVRMGEGGTWPVRAGQDCRTVLRERHHGAAQQSSCVRVLRWAIPWSSVGPQPVCSSYCRKRLKVVRFRFGGLTLPPAQGRLCVNSRSPFLKRSYCHLLAKLYNDDIDFFFLVDKRIYQNYIEELRFLTCNNNDPKHA